MYTFRCIYILLQVHYLFFSSNVAEKLFFSLSYPFRTFPPTTKNDCYTYSFVQLKYVGYINTSMIKLLRCYLLCMLNIDKIQIQLIIRLTRL
jgi:membrane-bound acyltransferase YfiQ involved in biofilm formation